MGEKCNYIAIADKVFPGAKILPVDINKGKYILCIPDSPYSFCLTYVPALGNFYNEGVLEGFEKTGEGLGLFASERKVRGTREIYSSASRKYFN